MYIVTRLFNLYAEYIILNARLYNSQVGIKITRRNSSNLRYANNTTLMAETEIKEPLDEGERGKPKDGFKSTYSKS